MRLAADCKVLKKIKKFAKNPKLISWSQRASWEIFCLEGLAKKNILETIVEHIKTGKPVEKDIMFKNERHKGKEGYILMPEIEGTRRYIKLQFINIRGIEKMHIFSAHNK